MNLKRIAAFADGTKGGNPAGVLISDNLPEDAEMRRIAAEVGYSETAFAMPQGDAWRVRYFSPESEVPFCGHATIALGAALAQQQGDGVFPLILNDVVLSLCPTAIAFEIHPSIDIAINAYGDIGNCNQTYVKRSGQGDAIFVVCSVGDVVCSGCVGCI